MNAHARLPLYQEDELDLIVQHMAAEARTNLWAFRQFMDPTLQLGWFPKDISDKLQLFYNRLRAGRRPKLILEAPPQHGKTRNLQDAIAWFAGQDPDLRVIYASFSADLGVITNNALQKMFDNPNYGLVFPDTAINSSNVVTRVGKPKRNSSFIEYAGRKGYFRNTTVQGQITGKSLDLGIIDDPLKGREAASSKTMRDKAWDWFMDDFFTRFSDRAGMILTATRWHVDDPTGRFIQKFPDAIVLKYPALSTGEVRGYDPRRRPNLPLFPEFKSYDLLQERREAMTSASWESLYQQSPIVVGGGLFPLERVKWVDALPMKGDIKKVVRYWDKAGTTDAGAWTVGCQMIALTDGRVMVSDVVRGQWSAFDREKHIMNTAEKDEAMFGKMGFETWTEQEPGSGGKESAERTIAMLQGYKVYKDKVTGNKETRAEPYAAQWQGGNVLIRRAQWNDAFADEHESFPSGKYKDQVDAAAGAFAQCVAKKYAYDTSMKWAVS